MYQGPTSPSSSPSHGCRTVRQASRTHQFESHPEIPSLRSWFLRTSFCYPLNDSAYLWRPLCSMAFCGLHSGNGMHLQKITSTSVAAHFFTKKTEHGWKKLGMRGQESNREHWSSETGGISNPAKRAILLGDWDCRFLGLGNCLFKSGSNRHVGRRTNQRACGAAVLFLICIYARWMNASEGAGPFSENQSLLLSESCHTLCTNSFHFSSF